MRTRPAVVYALGLLAASSLRTPLVHAEPTAQEKAQAANLFDQGMAAFQQKRCADAIPLFEGSAQISPSVGAQLYLGDCHKQLGRLASAYGAFREAARLANKQGDKREKVALDQAGQIEKQLAYLVIDVSAPSRVEGLEIRLDGKLVPSAVWGTSVPVDAGAHKLELTAPGHEPASVSVDIQPQPGRTTERIPTLQKQKAPPPPATPVAASVAPERTIDPQGRTLLVLQLLSDVPRDGTELRLDGTLRAPDEWTKLTELPPGPHRVDVTFRCRETLPLAMELAKGYLHTLVVSLPSAKTPAPPGCVDAHAHAPVIREAGWSTQRTVGIVVAGVGGAAAIVGGVVAFRAAGKATDAYDRYDDRAGDAQKPTYTTGLVVAGIGGAALLTGGVLVLTSGPPTKAASWGLSPLVGHRDGGVFLSGRF